MKVYKCKLNFLSIYSPGEDITYPRWYNDERLWLNAFTFLIPSPPFVLPPDFPFVLATDKETKVYNTFKKLRNL